MRCLRIARVLVLLLISVAGSALAQTPPVSKASIDDVTIIEGSAGQKKSAVFTVRLSLPRDVFTSIPIFVDDLTATEGLDYEWSGQFVSFPAGSQVATVSVTILGDDLPEEDETFQVKLVPLPPIQAEKAVGYCTIVDDDDEIYPLIQRIAKGEKGSINIRLKRTTTVAGQALVQSSDPDLLAVPSFIAIAVGATEASAQFTGLKVGAGSIRVTLPPSQGGRTDELFVTVYDNTTVTLDPMQLNLSLGTSANVTARIDPPPPDPIHVLVQAANSGIVVVPNFLATGADGSVSIPVRATGLGATTVNVAMLDVNGGASADLGVHVTLGPGPVITSVVPTIGRASGGESVRLNGVNFSDRCAVSFDGIPVPSSSAQSGGGALNVLTPPHDDGLVDIAVRCDTRSFVLPGAFAYLSTPARVTGISPTSGTVRGGTIVEIVGTDLRFGSCSAHFGQTPASLILIFGNTSISVASPAHAAGSVDVSLVCGSQTVTLPDAFSYLASDDPPATLISIFGLKQGSNTELFGSWFRRDDEVLLNGVALKDMTTPYRGEHFFTLPEIAGQAELTLRDYAGRALIRTVTITAPPDTPAVTKMPDRVALGSEFSVTGTGLRPGLTYMLGPAPVQVIPNPSLFDGDFCGCSPTTVVFRAPISVKPGTATFTIADHGTLLVTKSVEVTTSGPVVSSITPPCAAVEGGSLVTIAGSGFDDGAAVRFGTTQSIDVVVKDRFTIIARVPPPFGILQPQITVFNPDGSAATLTNAFTYKSSAADGGCGTGGGRHRATGH